LFFEEIPNGLDPRKTAFFLGGKDIIIDAAVRVCLMRSSMADLNSGPGSISKAVSIIIQFDYCIADV
jgi:hypothetical protein